MDEQADDAVGLLQALGLAPAIVFGTSGGAVILLNLLLRHADVLRGALVHEPPLMSVVDGGAALGEQFQAMTEHALATGGPRGAMELFLRANAGEAGYAVLEPALRERMLGNADVFFSVELASFVSYVPAPHALAQVRVPVVVLAGADHRAAALADGGYLYQAAEWVARGLGTPLQELPGAHAPYLDRPAEMVETIRPLLASVNRAM